MYKQARCTCKVVVLFSKTCCFFAVAVTVLDALVCVAWRFWLGAQSGKGGPRQRNREEIGAGARTVRGFLRLRRSVVPRQNRHATQAIDA